MLARQRTPRRRLTSISCRTLRRRANDYRLNAMRITNLDAALTGIIMPLEIKNTTRRRPAGKDTGIGLRMTVLPTNLPTQVIALACFHILARTFARHMANSIIGDIMIAIRRDDGRLDVLLKTFASTHR